MKTKLLISIFALMGVIAINNAKAQTYDPYDVQVINNLIKNNGLNATFNAPESWPTSGYSAFQITWTEETPKKIIRLNVPYSRLSGDASFAGLTKMTYLDCSDNQLTKLDLTNCSSLSDLVCISNGLFEINLTGVGHMIHISGSQTVWLTLYKNEAGRYSLPISLNGPVFFDMTYSEDIVSDIISYENGILESSDNTVDRCRFKIKTIGYEYSNGYLNGAMHFTYSDEVGINMPDKEVFKIYINSNNDTLFIDCEDFMKIMVKLYDMNGKEVIVHNVKGKAEINISHLQHGVYIVNILSDGKIVQNAKIVK